MTRELRDKEDLIKQSQVNIKAIREERERLLDEKD